MQDLNLWRNIVEARKQPKEQEKNSLNKLVLKCSKTKVAVFEKSIGKKYLNIKILMKNSNILFW